MIGYINGYNERSRVLSIIVPDFADFEILCDQQVTECEVHLCDGRIITPKQSRAIHAMCRDITNYISGFSEKEYVRNETMRMLQMAYLMDTDAKEEVRYALTNHYCELMDIELFSLSAKSSNAASVSLARDFLTYLIDFAIENAIPCSGKLIDRAEDISRYLYACLANRACCICGKHGSDVHHTDCIGMGIDREQIVHVGLPAMCLCREHHNLAHNMGEKSFEEQNKVFGIPLDEKLCGILGLDMKEKT
jgi:hypothetical protein